MIERSPSLTKFALVATIAMASLLAGCINSEIAAGRAELEKGNYGVAHERFVAASHSGKLSGRERRELAEGLCVTEAKLGAPGYPLAAQRITCANAVASGSSASVPILATIDTAERTKTAAAVHEALAAGDIAGGRCGRELSNFSRGGSGRDRRMVEADLGKHRPNSKADTTS